MSDKDDNDVTPIRDEGDDAHHDAASNPVPKGGYVMSDAEKKQRSRRNIAIGLMVIGFVVLIYMVTLLRLGSSVLEGGL